MLKLGMSFLFIFVCVTAIAQSYQYDMKGSFKLSPGDRKSINYSLKWSEENGAIKGTYGDNFFVNSAQVSGDARAAGRTFIVNFSGDQKGVRSLLILSENSRESKKPTSIAASVITRDASGNPLSTIKTTSRINLVSNEILAEKQEEDNCQREFGVLAGFCGMYVGTITEERDRRNKCNLLFADAVRLELTNDASVLLHLGEVNQLVNTPGHSLGRLPVDPQTNIVDMLSRVCRPLTGVNSASGSCKRLHLNGEFSRVGDRKRFKGSYTITEEGTNNTCLYTLSMDRNE